MYGKSLVPWALVLMLSLPSVGAAQQASLPAPAVTTTTSASVPSGEEELAAALASAKTEEERATLLSQHQELITPLLGAALNKQGARLISEDDYPRALAIYRLAQSIEEKIGDRAGMAVTYIGIGNIYRIQGDLQQALDYYRKCLAIRENLGDRAGMAQALNNIGIVYAIQSDYATALEYHHQSLTIKEALGDRAAIAASLNNLGNVYGGLGDYTQALDYFQKSLKIKEEMGSKDHLGIAQTLVNIGHTQALLGDYSAALETLQRSLTLTGATGREAGLIDRLILIGNIYHLQGNDVQALSYFQQSLQRSEKIGDKSNLAYSLTNIGDVYYGQGDYTKSLDYFRRALALAEALNDRTQIAYVLRYLGGISSAQGDHTKAIDYLQKSLKTAEATADKNVIAQVLGATGEAYFKQGDYAQALEFAERASAIARQTGGRESLWSVLTLAGRALRAQKRPAQARQALEEAVSIIESLRMQVAGDEEQEQRFFESKVSAYQEMVSLLLEQKRDVEALAYAERAKARVLLDVLHSGRANITKAMTVQEREREQKLNNSIVSLNARIVRAASSGQSSDQSSLADLDTRLQKARLEYEAFQMNLYAAHPELKAQRGKAQPLTLEETRALLGNTKSALLEFVTTEERTYLFVLTMSGQGQSAPDLKVYPLEIKRKAVAERAELFRQQLARRDMGFAESAQQLYDLLLRPAREQLRGRDALIIVPDGMLWNLPFQALQSAPGHYLLEDYAVSYAPSLTVLREMQRPQRRESNAAPAEEAATLLAVGNPALGQQTLRRARSGFMAEELSPLPEAENQVVSLGKLYGAEQSKVYVGANAREDRVKAEAGRFQILQFATHGILNDRNPMYSHVLLSQPEGSNDDGLLEAWEMMKLNLHADMVVLSACETALGRVGAGEGVIGMTWALFVAGSPTTVVSQWKVESASTTELMLEFHRNLKAGARNPPEPMLKARALQQASLKLLRTNGQYRHPFYWAGFVVVGKAT